MAALTILAGIFPRSAALVLTMLRQHGASGQLMTVLDAEPSDRCPRAMAAHRISKVHGGHGVGAPGTARLKTSYKNKPAFNTRRRRQVTRVRLIRLPSWRRTPWSTMAASA
jgi:hypothetical protein